MPGFGKDKKGAILYDHIDFDLATLAARDVVSGNSSYTALEQDFRILKSDFFVDFAPQAAGDIILWGIADGNLSAAAIESCIEAVPLEQNSLLNEEAMRAVFPLGILGENSAGSGNLVQKFSHSLRWTFRADDGWVYWAYNLDDATALTTGSELSIFAKHFGVWLN